LRRWLSHPFSSPHTLRPAQLLSSSLIGGNIESWNDELVKLVSESTPETVNGLYVYGASKTEGERFAYQWVKENSPHFVFNSVLPNLAVSISCSSFLFRKRVFSENLKN
jgi:hypothetical protein